MQRHSLVWILPILFTFSQAAFFSPDVSVSETKVPDKPKFTTLKQLLHVSYHEPVVGNSLKKAPQTPINASEINTVRDLVKAVINSRAAPVIRTVLGNLDRDLFKLFTPTDSPFHGLRDRYHVVFQHAYPTQTPKNSTTEATTNTTEINGERILGGESTLAPIITKYRINKTKATTTPEPQTSQPDSSNDSEEDDEDERWVQNKIQDLYERS